MTPPRRWRQRSDDAPTAASRLADPARPLQLPRAPRPAFRVGALSLGLGTLDGFAAGGAELTQDHRGQVAEIAGRIVALSREQPGHRLTITGYADRAEGADLGHRRALAVAAALVEAGVPQAMIELGDRETSAAGVATAGQQPASRRVEVRFGGAPSDRESYRPPQWLAASILSDVRRDVIDASPPQPPDYRRWVQPALSTPRTLPPARIAPGGQEPQTRQGSLGDVVRAFAAEPDVRRLIDNAGAQARGDLGRLPTPGRVLLGTVAGASAAGFIAGIASNRGTREGALDRIDGLEIPIPVPGLRGVFAVPHTGHGAIGGGVRVDIIRLFGWDR
jgi:outer membrane protein OmpA-like peptidoglycan-associated protein